VLGCALLKFALDLLGRVLNIAVVVFAQVLELLL
jgi:hypothetical protein